MDTWRPNSYGYPNPFQDDPRYREKAAHAWDMFTSFAERTSYREVKEFWDENSQRRVRPHAVESWKATFEELGLLYVLQRDDNIVVTPGGQQQLNAVAGGNLEQFCWVGVNLLLRYPLSHVPERRSRGPKFAASDLLPYWYLFACLLDYGGLWQSEYYHLATAFTVAEARQRAALIPAVRSDPERCHELFNFNEALTDDVYNALNQGMVHASLNHVVFSSQRAQSPYGRYENRWYVKDAHLDLLQAALGGTAGTLPTGCADVSNFVDRMPVAAPPIEEQAYFEYLGAAVQSRGESPKPGNLLRSITIGDEYVPLLKAGEDFVRTETNIISGKIASLCILAPGMRVICSDDLTKSYMVTNKQLSGADVSVWLRPARKITDPQYVAQRFEEPVN